MSQTRWMGVDLGEARIGLSLSDPELALALPAGNIQVAGDYFESIMQIIELCEQKNVSQVIVGYPLLLNGVEGHSAKKAKRWASALQKHLDSLAQKGQLRLLQVPKVKLKDERLTTVTAHRQLFEAGLDNKKHKPRIDQQSAVLLLQSALEEHARVGRSELA